MQYHPRSLIPVQAHSKLFRVSLTTQKGPTMKCVEIFNGRRTAHTSDGSNLENLFNAVKVYCSILATTALMFEEE